MAIQLSISKKSFLIGCVVFVWRSLKNGKSKGTLSLYFAFLFSQRKNASQAHKKLCAVYGDEALKERQCQNWFDKFGSGDFSLKDEKRSGCPVEVDDNLIKAIIDSDRHSTTREIADKLHVSHICIENHLKQLGYV